MYKQRTKSRNSQISQIGFVLLIIAAGIGGFFWSTPTKLPYYYRPDGALISSSLQESNKSITYINTLRETKGLKPIIPDDRAYNLAVFRAKDMDTNGYASSTNQKTGLCAYSIKTRFGFKPDEQVFETRMGYFYPLGGSGPKGFITMQAVLERC